MQRRFEGADAFPKRRRPGVWHTHAFAVGMAISPQQIHPSAALYVFECSQPRRGCQKDVMTTRAGSRFQGGRLVGDGEGEGDP